MLPPRSAVITAVTTRLRRTLTTAGPDEAARRRRIRRIPTLLIAGVLLALWGIFALGWYFAVVVAIAAVTAAAVVLTRRRPDVAAAAATALITSAAPIVLIAVGADSGRPLAEITPLLMFTFAGPLPTLAAWMCRPVISRPLNAVLGSAILLTGAAVQWFLGAAGGWVLYVALLAALTVIAVRYRRALRRTRAHFTTDHAGWTDLGRRALNPGSTPQLLIGHGRAVAVFTHDETPAPTAAQLQGYVSAAIGLADRLMLTPARVQPVVVQARSRHGLAPRDGQRRHRRQRCPHRRARRATRHLRRVRRHPPRPRRRFPTGPAPAPPARPAADPPRGRRQPRRSEPWRRPRRNSPPMDMRPPPCRPAGAPPPELDRNRQPAAEATPPAPDPNPADRPADIPDLDETTDQETPEPAGADRTDSGGPGRRRRRLAGMGRARADPTRGLRGSPPRNRHPGRGPRHR